MTGKELLTYKMNREEQIIWYRFCVDIKKKLELLNHWFSSPYWRYDIAEEEFIPLD